MFKKLSLKISIEKCKRNIETLELKRIESQKALVNALIKKEDPNDNDMNVFDEYTLELEKEKNRLKELIEELEKLENE